MTRKLCDECQRPEKACICDFTTDIVNKVHVVILQHPSEVSQTKGTVTLLAKSLRSCQVIVGENFNSSDALQRLIEQYRLLLLYPGEQAQELSQGLTRQLVETKHNDKLSDKKPLCLLILDGTWKKAYRMYMLTTKIHGLPQVCLPENIANAGQYNIRKVAKKNALSSLEACCYALALLEHSHEFNISPSNIGKYQLLFEKFKQFNQFQLSFRSEREN
jgi:DTW domain-containing protein YfiP